MSISYQHGGSRRRYAVCKQICVLFASKCVLLASKCVCCLQANLCAVCKQVCLLLASKCVCCLQANLCAVSKQVHGYQVAQPADVPLITSVCRVCTYVHMCTVHTQDTSSRDVPNCTVTNSGYEHGSGQPL
jgi:hypothetical protein